MFYGVGLWGGWQSPGPWHTPSDWDVGQTKMCSSRSHTVPHPHPLWTIYLTFLRPSHHQLWVLSGGLTAPASMPSTTLWTPLHWALPVTCPSWAARRGSESHSPLCIRLLSGRDSAFRNGWCTNERGDQWKNLQSLSSLFRLIHSYSLHYPTAYTSQAKSFQDL